MAGTVKKSQTVATRKYSYKYSDLATVQKFLADNQMDYYQYIDRLEGIDYIMTVKIINDEEMPPLRGCPIVQSVVHDGEFKNPMQELGSAISYARRYSLLMAFGIATEDDDAETFTKPASQSGDAVPYERKESDKKASDKQIALINRLTTNADRTNLVMRCLADNGVESLAELTIKQASDLINDLKDN